MGESINVSAIVIGTDSRNVFWSTHNSDTATIYRTSVSGSSQWATIYAHAVGTVIISIGNSPSPIQEARLAEIVVHVTEGPVLAHVVSFTATRQGGGYRVSASVSLTENAGRSVYVYFALLTMRNSFDHSFATGELRDPIRLEPNQTLRGNFTFDTDNILTVHRVEIINLRFVTTD